MGRFLQLKLIISFAKNKLKQLYHSPYLKGEKKNNKILLRCSLSLSLKIKLSIYYPQNLVSI